MVNRESIKPTGILMPLLTLPRPSLLEQESELRTLLNLLDAQVVEHTHCIFYSLLRQSYLRIFIAGTRILP
jgi:hypothetical protein